LTTAHPGAATMPQSAPEDELLLGQYRFRIKIWHADPALEQDVVDYDNQMDPSTEGTVSEGTVIRSDDIVIHAPNK
jgi:hypothetical protein